MHYVFKAIEFIVGVGLIAVMLIDGFETILQPRRVTHKYRFARVYYRLTWQSWKFIAQKITAPKRREAMLGIFGPLSLLTLFISWVAGLIVGFAALQWSLSTPIHADDAAINGWTYFYLSGTTFFTLGYGDITPLGIIGRALAVAESGLGFGFMAVIISYLPLLSQAFSTREVTISLLDARAGSPPSAHQLLVRLARAHDLAAVNSFLAEWETWCAELLESHLSFPVLSYYRSQHDNQSWLAALTTMLDTCAILMAHVKAVNPYRAELTFAMARHAAVDLSLILKVTQKSPEQDRLPLEKHAELEKALKAAGIELCDDAPALAKFNDLRDMYEPFVYALSQRFLVTLPSIVSAPDAIDNWQRSPGRRAPGLQMLSSARADEDHFAV